MVDKYSPIIIHYAKPDTHFVVVISRSNDRFIIADPARGIKLIEKKELVEKWSGIILVGVSEKHTKNKEVIEEITKNEIKKREKLERDLK